MCRKERIWRQQKCAWPGGTANTSRVHSPLFAIIHIWQPRNVTPELLGLPLSRYMARVFHIWSYLPCRLFSFLLMWAIWQFGVVSKLSQKQTPLCYWVRRMEMETFSFAIMGGVRLFGRKQAKILKIYGENMHKLYYDVWIYSKCCYYSKILSYKWSRLYVSLLGM